MSTTNRDFLDFTAHQMSVYKFHVFWNDFLGMNCNSFWFLLSLTGLHIKETEDNEAVVSTVIDLHRLMKTKHLPAVQGWVQVGTNTQGSCM